MTTEYEIKLLDVNKDEVMEKLAELGFASPTQLQFRRYVYDLPGQNGAWLRLRTDGTTTTLTRKQFIADSVDGVQEQEIEVSRFEVCHELLEALGYKATSYQENHRLLYSNTEVEVAIDEWPQIKPYVEIEAKNEATVQKYLKKLDISYTRRTSKPTTYVYELSGINLDQIKHLVF